MKASGTNFLKLKCGRVEELLLWYASYVVFWKEILMHNTYSCTSLELIYNTGQSQHVVLLVEQWSKHYKHILYCSCRLTHIQQRLTNAIFYKFWLPALKTIQAIPAVWEKQDTCWSLIPVKIIQQFTSFLHLVVLIGRTPEYMSAVAFLETVIYKM